MRSTVRRISQGPKHHLFGFHDLVESNAKGDLLLSLEVEDISHPPLPGEACAAGVIELPDGVFRPVHSTRAWNYPQGARQQWFGDGDLFFCNDRDAQSGKLISRLSDARARSVVETFPFPVYCHAASSRKAFYINFDRVHRVGGYGYAGGVDPYAAEDVPGGDGVFAADLETGKSELLVSLREIASCGGGKPVRTGFPHYATHLYLNPDSTRLAFLHRYRVPDGGETTCLMTVGVDGSGLRCLAKGTLSHFTWVDSRTVFIWGRDERGLCRIRESPLLRIPGVCHVSRFAKGVLKRLRGLHSGRPGKNAAAAGGGRSFLLIRDSEERSQTPVAVGILTEDGHPMANPARGGLLVNDTYPDREGVRTLMLFDLKSMEREDIGRFKMLDAVPDTSSFDWRAAWREIDRRIRKRFPRDLYLFTRSGYHCDLHPRWGWKGEWLYFDSIHEGSRQIYGLRLDP